MTSQAHDTKTTKAFFRRYLVDIFLYPSVYIKNKQTNNVPVASCVYHTAYIDISFFIHMHRTIGLC